MLDILREGGVVIWFTLVFGLVGLVLAALTVRSPSPERIAVCDSAQKVVLFTVLGGLAGAVAQTLAAVSLAMGPDFADKPNLPKQILAEGLSECMAVPILGFAMLGLIALLTTVARMRSTAA